MRRTRTLAAGAALFTAMTLVAACGSSGEGGGTATGEASTDAVIHVGSLYEPQNLSNVDGGGQGVTEALNGNVYESLFRLTDDGDLENLLAEDYSVSPDGLTYTVTLREGVSFHSGKPVTSEDVRSSVERVTAESSQSARKSSFEPLASIETPDERTVVFTLATPSISFPYNLSYVWIVNTEAGDLKTAEDGTGPYTVGDWTRGSSLSLARWDDYWGEPAANSEVVFHYC
jgi:peptide/nickel transport system substrate-binding protein